MKQPLMLTPVRIPPAQAEALYDASLETDRQGHSSFPEASWPEDEWDDDTLSAYSCPSVPNTGRAVIAQH
jgi:hypothetical protein